MGILRAMAIRRRVKEMQEYARVLPLPRRSFGIGEIFWHRYLSVLQKKCRQPYAAWLSELSQALMEAQQRQAYSYTEVAADFDQIWIEHADKLYESSGLKQEDDGIIYITWTDYDIWKCNSTGDRDWQVGWQLYRDRQ